MILPSHKTLIVLIYLNKTTSLDHKIDITIDLLILLDNKTQVPKLIVNLYFSSI